MRDKLEAASAALLINSPGLILMAGVHYTWALVALAVVLASIVIAVARPENSSNFDLLHCPRPPIPVPVPNHAFVPEKEAEQEEEHELTGV